MRIAHTGVTIAAASELLLRPELAEVVDLVSVRLDGEGKAESVAKMDEVVSTGFDELPKGKVAGEVIDGDGAYVR